MADFTPQQLQAITTVDTNVAVSAGAGSGKTRVLVERFLYILRRSLEQGQKLAASEILAITFTRKAAAEMKERVRRSMDVLAHTDTANSFFWRQQLKELERAQITTIHSLCNRILKENPVEAELDPSFQVADEFEGGRFVEDCLKKYFLTALRNQDKKLQQLTEAYGAFGVMRQLQSLLPQLDELAKCSDAAAGYKASISKEQECKENLCSVLEELAARREEVKGTKQAQQLELLAENLTEVLDGIRQDPADLTAYKTYAGGLAANTRLKALVKESKLLREQLEMIFADKAALPLAESWQAVAAGFAAFLQQQRQEADFLSFDDLENYALNLLKSQPHLCENYRQKYRYIMVDEFQDTNEKQKQLVYLLCGGDYEKLQGNRLFVVGDPKQSIYRFRGADVSVFAQVRRDIQDSGGKIITLNDNFRTADTILAACNEVFTELLGVDVNEPIFFEALAPHIVSEAKPELRQVVYTKDQTSEKRQLEARAVAGRIAALHAEGTGYGEMAVLLSAMTRCDVLTEALEAKKIPYQVIDGRGFYERQEVLDLLNLLRALHNKHCSLELAGVLRSPYFGLDDETITTLFLQQSNSCLWDNLMTIDAAAVKESQRPLLLRAREIFTELRQAAALLGLQELWQEVWQRLEVDAVLSLQQNGKAKLANAVKLRHLAAEYSSGRQGTLSSWLEYVAALIASGARETAANLEAADAVTIMTIHKSKGLEFGTVLLPMLDAGSQSDITEIKFHPQLGLGIKAVLPDGSMAESSVLQQLKEMDKQLQKEERKRQLYVAMTRAKNRLIMSGTFCADKESKAENWFKSLKEVLADSDLIEFTEIAADSLPDTVTVQQDDAAKAVPDEAALQAAAPLDMYKSLGRKVFSATALQTYLHCQRRYYYQQLGLPGCEEAGTQGNQLPAYVTGLIVHTALEKYRGDEEKAFQAAVDKHAGGRADLSAYAKKLLHDYLVSDLYKTIPSAHQREVKFNCMQQELLLTGVIDCLYTAEDGLLRIIDYKTGRPPEDGSVPKGYAYQLALYKAAAEQLFERPVHNAQLHFLQNLSVCEPVLGEETLQEALELCRQISSKADEDDFICSTDKCGSCPYGYLCPRK